MSIVLLSIKRKTYPRNHLSTSLSYYMFSISYSPPSGKCALFYLTDGIVLLPTASQSRSCLLTGLFFCSNQASPAEFSRVIYSCNQISSSFVDNAFSSLLVSLPLRSLLELSTLPMPSLSINVPPPQRKSNMAGNAGAQKAPAYCACIIAVWMLFFFYPTLIATVRPNKKDTTSLSASTSLPKPQLYVSLLSAILVSFSFMFLNPAFGLFNHAH